MRLIRVRLLLDVLCSQKIRCYSFLQYHVPFYVMVGRSGVYIAQFNDSPMTVT